MSREKFPWLYADLESRLNNVIPRFPPPIHRCPKCDRCYLCTDRYVQDFCPPQREFPGWHDITCSPCMAPDVYDDDDKAAWWQAHSVKQPSDILLQTEKQK